MPYLSPSEPLSPSLLADLLGSAEAVRLSPAAEQHLAAHPPVVAAGEVLSASQPGAAGLLLAYAVGTGPEVPAALIRRMLLLQAHRLGADGAATLPAVRRLLDFYNRDVWPVVYEQGAVGADGDQVPLAHLSLPLLGLGEVNYQGYRLAAADVLGLFGWEPLAPSTTEGLAWLSGNQFGLAYATEALARAEHLVQAAIVIEALTGAAYGTALPGLLEPNQLLDQDEISNHPSVPPAGPDALTQARQAIVAAGEQGSGGRQFLAAEDLLTAAPTGAAAPLGFAPLAQAVAAVGSRSARRLAHLVAGQQALPRHLAAAPTLGGLRALPTVAASLLSHTMHLCAPPAGPLASEMRRVVENAEQLLGMELLAAVQALDLRPPTPRSPALERAVVAFREHVTFVPHDRVLYPDLHRAARFVREFAWE